MSGHIAPTNCDVIVIGGGDNGLLCASYLAKLGARTLLVERHKSSGAAGNLDTPAFQGPYRFDLLPPHMIVMGERAPCHSDLDLAAQGLAYVTPPVQIAFHSKDDRALVLHQDPVKSAKAIARFNAGDAGRFLAMYAEVQQLCERILLPALYATEGGRGVAAQLGSTNLGKRLAALSAMTPIEIVDEHGFESPMVREALLYLATFWGLDPHTAGVGHIPLLWIHAQLNVSIARSGNLAPARAFYQTLLENGGDYVDSARVDRILIENGRAAGVRLTDGREIHADAVVSALGVAETFLDMVGAPHLSSSLSDASQNWEWQDTSLLSCHFGYKGEAPSYRAAAYDPDTDQAYLHVFGIEARGDVEALRRSLLRGAIPEGHGRATCLTQFDPLHAGFGQVYGPLQTLRFEMPVPARLRSGVWSELRGACQEAALDLWRRYADRVVDGDLSYAMVVTPDDLQQRLPSYKHGSYLGGEFTPRRAGLAQTPSACSDYRSEIPSLYLAGASTHGGGLIHFAAGYNAARAVAQDLLLASDFEEPVTVRVARAAGYLPEAEPRSAVDRARNTSVSSDFDSAATTNGASL